MLSILTGNITAWYGNSTELDRKALQRVVCSAEGIIGSALTCITDIYIRQCKTKARRIIKDPNCLFSLLQSGRRYQIHQASAERLRKSFYPQAARILSEDTAEDYFF